MTDKYRRQVELIYRKTKSNNNCNTYNICTTYYCTYVSLHARYYHDRQLVDGVTASFWSKQTVECGKQFTGKSSASYRNTGCGVFKREIQN